MMQRRVIKIKILESSENYLEAILMIQREKGEVRSIDIANKLHFSKASVSVAMKNLRNNGFISTDEKGFISLEPKGKEIAEKVLEKHEVISGLLITLGVDPEIASEDACRMEHAMSDESFEAIKKFHNIKNN